MRNQQLIIQALRQHRGPATIDALCRICGLSQEAVAGSLSHLKANGQVRRLFEVGKVPAYVLRF